MSVPSTLLDALSTLLGPKGLLTETTDLAPYLAEERGLFQGAATVVVRPANTEECAEVVRLCHAAGVSIVPQGGNTGLVGGAVSASGQVILATGRMNRILAIDPVEHTMTVEAGCILQDLQKAADEADCLFPLSLGAEGTCQIGGNLSSNAGGVNVLRYGNTRDLVLGLEVVLPDGQIWNGLKALGKDNTGYALKHLFVGSEGTLGIITRAVLKLFPKAKEKQTALCALSDLEAAPKLLSLARRQSGDLVDAFELIGRFGMEIAEKHLDGVRNPLEDAHDWYALIELSSSRENADLRTVFETILETAFETELIADAVIAESLDQAHGLWRIREGLPEAQKHEGASIKHDVSVPVSRVPEFIARANDAVTAALPGLRPCPFGHVGDGNVHYNLTQPEDMDPQSYLAKWEDMNRIVHDIVVDMNGSISAEHGIGSLKVEELEHYKAPLELDLMRAVKKAIDPRNLMNPGKVVA
ncbi:MAG: FAD-binding oxidoreductase [Rhodospirillaceae bacterium]